MNISKQGFLKVRVDGKILNLTYDMKLDRYKIHDIEILIDRLTIKDEELILKRLRESINTALYHGDDSLIVISEDSPEPKFF